MIAKKLISSIFACAIVVLMGVSAFATTGGEHVLAVNPDFPQIVTRAYPCDRCNKPMIPYRDAVYATNPHCGHEILEAGIKCTSCGYKLWQERYQSPECRRECN